MREQASPQLMEDWFGPFTSFFLQHFPMKRLATLEGLRPFHFSLSFAISANILSKGFGGCVLHMEMLMKEGAHVGGVHKRRVPRQVLAIKLLEKS